MVVIFHTANLSQPSRYPRSSSCKSAPLPVSHAIYPDSRTSKTKQDIRLTTHVVRASKAPGRRKVRTHPALQHDRSTVSGLPDRPRHPCDRPCFSIATPNPCRHVTTPLHPLLLTTSYTQAKENLGIVAGTELPRRGRCTHYGKSYRWFRYVGLQEADAAYIALHASTRLHTM